MNTTDTADTTGATGTIARTGATRALGRYGEELAARRLTATGMRVLARNWRCGRTGEIDIVAHDGDTLVICEVKTRRHGAYEHPMAAVTPRKAERLRRLADCWLDRSGTLAPAGGVRIDLVGVVLPRRGAPVLTHARGVA
ncbi:MULTISPECIES: YraN family protein [unclassified Streptomyces]|uniref:YraN family protein n=1 Tax=unclassified Streptomyces TaxID=2593676 RepID=UPI0036EC0E52